MKRRIVVYLKPETLRIANEWAARRKRTRTSLIEDAILTVAPLSLMDLEKQSPGVGLLCPICHGPFVTVVQGPMFVHRSCLLELSEEVRRDDWQVADAAEQRKWRESSQV